MIKSLLRVYIVLGAVAFALALEVFYPVTHPILLAVTILAALFPLWKALQALIKLKISIDVFNLIALVVSFATDEIRSAAFILMMLLSAELLDFHTEAGTRKALDELLKLKPATALKESDGAVKEVSVDEIRLNDIVVVEAGARIPVDGVIIFGKAFINEASVTGESVPIEKSISDQVLSGTLNDSGVIKIRASKVGKESTIEKIVALTKEAAQNKSKSEKIADQFTKIFLPIVALTGLVTYLVTHNIMMVAALFLIACADDMAVAIPLAIVAALGQAAKRGTIIKGGQYLDVLRKIKYVVFDKTGTLTYGRLEIKQVIIEASVDEKIFWKLIAVAEKFSEHPKGKAIFKRAAQSLKEIPDADEVKVYKGAGIWASYQGDEVAIGDEQLAHELGWTLSENSLALIQKNRVQFRETVLIVMINKKFAGFLAVSDIPRAEAAQSIRQLKELGIEKVIMFTGDSSEIATDVAKALGVDEFRAAMSPEDKLRGLDELTKLGPVAMIGDGINDAPALARADVGIAMGEGGTAVAVEAADVIILTDNLERIGEMIRLSQRTWSVITGDIVIWLVSNLAGFALVFTGVAGPVFAAFYNFATDFLPLLNSLRIFRARR